MHPLIFPPRFSPHYLTKSHSLTYQTCPTLQMTFTCIFILTNKFDINYMKRKHLIRNMNDFLNLQVLWSVGNNHEVNFWPYLFTKIYQMPKILYCVVKWSTLYFYSNFNPSILTSVLLPANKIVSVQWLTGQEWCLSVFLMQWLGLLFPTLPLNNSGCHW